MMFGERWKDQSQHRPANVDYGWYSDAEDHPFSLLALQWTGHPPVAVELDGHNERHLDELHEIAKQITVDFQHKRCMWEEDGRHLPCKKHDESPARPARHE